MSARRTDADARGPGGATWEVPLRASAVLHSVVDGLLDADQTEVDGEALPNLWGADRRG